MFMSKQRATSWGFALGLVAALSILAMAADARVGGGSSFGSRGSRTYSSPPATNTAPSVAPVEKSFTQPSKPTTAQAPMGGASRFGGWRSILLGGLFAGVLASIFGFGVLASVLGFLLQAALIVGVISLVMGYFRSRRARPAIASAAGVQSRLASIDYRVGAVGSGSASTLEIGPQDFDAFEQMLGEIQIAYGRRDEHTLAPRVTPEMLSYFAEQLEADRRKGLRNEVSSPKLLQGDLAEAWREGNDEYATVAMRFSLIDVTVDSLGRVVSGSPTTPQEVTEVWTFRRPRRGTSAQWELSAIQQKGQQLPLAS
jgi:predicted lipid-binding transport protein (Tim44 family)